MVNYHYCVVNISILIVLFVENVIQNDTLLSEPIDAYQGMAPRNFFLPFCGK